MTSEQINVSSTARTQMLDVSRQVAVVLKRSGLKSGICYVYVPHTTAGVTINENADPDVCLDIDSILESTVPWNNNYRHMEGNSAAHVKASMMGFTATIPFEKGHLLLGTWQGIYFCEFDGPRNRKLIIKVIEG
jgi:secondary thiamine-phosphate synthase enzyme